MKRTVESYSLIENQLPSIPTPHDCIITGISMLDGWLILTFEDDLSGYDSIQHFHPTARSLTIKIHLLSEQDVEILAYEHRRYENVYVVRKQKKIFDLPKKEKPLEYLDHKVAYGTIQLELCGDNLIIIRLDADQVVLEWLE